MKYSRTEFYANATLSSQVLCCKQYSSLCLDEYLAIFPKYIQVVR